MFRNLLLSFALSSLILAQVSLGDDVQPPSWRGEESTTSQLWGFGYRPDPRPGYENHYLPDGPAPGGLPPLAGTYANMTGNQWYQEDTLFGSGRTGLWEQPSSLRAVVDNYDSPNPFKWMRVQLTWHEYTAGATPALLGLNPLAAPGKWPHVVAEEDLGYGWKETTYEWFLEPNPTWESFYFSGSIVVDELIVDTWCAPEPTALALLALGGLFLRRRG